jgi:hypothetical protein
MKSHKLIALDVLFLTIVGVLGYFKGEVALPPWYVLVLMGLATMRAAQSLSFNEIGEPIRNLFCTVEPDSCGAGNNVHPKNGSVLGSLLSCPICTGTWAGLAIYALWLVVPNVGTVLVVVLAIACMSQLLHYLSEVLSWGARAFRVLSGAIAPDERS